MPDGCLADLRERGYLLFEGFLEADELAAAQEALWLHYPRPEVYFADPVAHAWLATDQWAGEVSGPWRSWNLNRLAFHPDLLDLAERFLGSADLRLYEASLWAKYAGAVDYDQRHHRDFVNHSLVVPKRSRPATQMQSWILLSDVGDEDGPTKLDVIDALDAEIDTVWALIAALQTIFTEHDGDPHIKGALRLANSHLDALAAIRRDLDRL